MQLLHKDDGLFISPDGKKADRISIWKKKRGTCSRCGTYGETIVERYYQGNVIQQYEECKYCFHEQVKKDRSNQLNSLWWWT